VLGTLLTIAEHLEQGQFDAAFRQGRTLGVEFAGKIPSLAL
jgi:hypothetical protein